MVNSQDEDDDGSRKNEAHTFNFHLLKSDNDLFDEKSYVAHHVVNVKRVNVHDGDDWEIWENNKITLILKGTRFNSIEKKFLKTVEGMKFLVAEYKNGVKSVVKIKDRLKQVLKYD